MQPPALVCLYIGLLNCIVALPAVPLTHCFPSDFLFGATAYQQDGTSDRDFNLQDVYCRAQTEVHCGDMFHRLNKDLEHMSNMGLSSFRFTMSWSRIMRWNNDTRRMEPNPQGITFYHTLLDNLNAHRLQPIVILSNMELSLPFETQVNSSGWLNPDIVTHFQDLAEVAFREYGRKVKYWATFNKPLTFLRANYDSYDAEMELSDTNKYTVAHNVLLSHAGAVAIFRKLKLTAETSNLVAASARIGIVLNADFSVPVDKSNALDAERKMLRDLDWFLMPLVTGDYPKLMHKRVGNRLPQFSHEESLLVKNSYDVFLFDQYYSGSVTDASLSDLAAVKWLHGKDPSTNILLTQTGWGKDKEDDNETLNQLSRFQAHVKHVYKAVVEEKIPIIGYTAWSLPDYNEREGSHKHHVDLYNVNLSFPMTLLTTRCLNGGDHEPFETSAEEKQVAATLHEKVVDSEASADDVGIPWSLSDVIILVIVGVVVLVAITCEVMRELRISSRGSSEELQVLITVE